MITHVMVDLETLGNVPATGVLLALGAQAFQMTDEMLYPSAEDFDVCIKGKQLYYPIDVTSQLNQYQLVIEGDTLSWWLDPSRIDQLRTFMTSKYRVDLRVAFERFMWWVKEVCPKQDDLRLWSHGVTYDCMHLEQKWLKVLHTSFNRVCPFRQMHDTRTLFAVYEEKFGKIPYTVLPHQRLRHHHPLEDAWVQACAVQHALKGLING